MKHVKKILVVEVVYTDIQVTLNAPKNCSCCGRLFEKGYKTDAKISASKTGENAAAWFNCECMSTQISMDFRSNILA